MSDSGAGIPVPPDDPGPEHLALAEVCISADQTGQKFGTFQIAQGSKAECLAVAEALSARGYHNFEVAGNPVLGRVALVAVKPYL